MAFYTGGRDPWADPLTTLRRIQDEVNRTFGGARTPLASDYPPLNVWRGQDGIVVTAEVPGARLEDLEITVHQNTLTLKGRRESEAAGKDATFHRQEREYGAFARTVTLPYNVGPEGVTASASNGILHVELPRPETDKPKRIQIKAG